MTSPATNVDPLIQSITRFATSIGAPEDALDDYVTDAMIEESLDELNTLENDDDQDNCIGDAESSASSINRAGLEAQISYLLEGYDNLEEGEKDIRSWLLDSLDME